MARVYAEHEKRALYFHESVPPPEGNLSEKEKENFSFESDSYQVLNSLEQRELVKLTIATLPKLFDIVM